ncbi:PQQ-binding-like beta-propeller repeat protein [Planctomycetales bacterium ZRK34]|nr:PQQ-binding-like beta-propeller repeat protein [Planctomycetales bacterium ZRK34]
MRRISTGMVMMLMLSAATAGADEPSQWRGVQHDGVYHETIDWPAGGPRELWAVDVGIGYSGFAISDGRVYTMGNVDGEDVIWCLNADTGREVWSARYPQELVPLYNPGGPNAAPVVEGEWLYTLSKQGLLTCWGQADGVVRWRIDLVKQAGAEMPRWGFASTPLIIDDVIYLNANEHGMAIDKHTGKVVWSSPAAECGYAAAIAMTCRDQPALALLSGKAVFVVQRDNGQVMWRVDWPTKMGENSADPIAADGLLYVSSWWGMGAAVYDPNVDGVEPRWRNKELQNHISSPVLHDGYLYGFDGPVHRDRVAGAMRCVQWATGKTMWSHPGLKGSVICAGDQLLILSHDGALILADASPAGYHERARIEGLGKRTWNYPVPHRGRIYIRDADGRAICLTTRP